VGLITYTLIIIKPCGEIPQATFSSSNTEHWPSRGQPDCDGSENERFTTIH
jgi:hypothetical protein